KPRRQGKAPPSFNGDARDCPVNNGERVGVLANLQLLAIRHDSFIVLDRRRRGVGIYLANPVILIGDGPGDVIASLDNGIAAAVMPASRQYKAVVHLQFEARLA